jgi:hypothetical protein
MEFDDLSMDRSSGFHEDEMPSFNKTTNMKQNPKHIAVLAALALAGSASAATTISYSYETISNSTDTSWVIPAGATSIKAMNMGSGGSTSFGGVTWLTTNAINESYNSAAPISMFYHSPGQAWGTRYDGYYAAQAPNGILWEGTYSGLQANGVDFRVELNNFTVGQEYLVQFVVADTRAGETGRTITIDGYSSNIAFEDSSAYTYAYTDGKFAVVTARFTPAPGDTSFEFRPLVESGAAGLQVNAIHVLTIPEPSALLLGGLGLLGLLRRRR